MVSTELLRRYPLFAGQNHYTLKEMAMISDEISVQTDEWLFREHEEAGHLYMVLEGKVALTMYLFHHGEPEHMKMTDSVEQGELLGWSSLVKPHIYTLGACAEVESRLLKIEAEPLRQLLDDNPEYGYVFMKKISEVIGERLLQKTVQLMSVVLE